MPPTTLLYLNDFTQLECEARVVDVIEGNDKIALVLDQTVFYPQGGGQPYDKGIIQSPNGIFRVEEVRHAENALVKHIGVFESGSFSKGENAHCRVDKERRELHSRIHSAGHLIDWAIQKLQPTWTPDPRGYHFPNGPYVTYNGTLENVDKEKLKNEIEALCADAIQKGQEVSIRFMTKDEMKSICRSIPDAIPEPARVIMFGAPSTSSGQVFGVPCGGTHVANLSEIKSMTVRKIKPEGGNIRVGYDV